MNNKTLIMTFDLQGAPDWQAKAIQMQLRDWLNKNKNLLPNENLVIMPTKGDTRLFWLEGDPDNIEDIKTLEKIKDKLKPVMEVALGLKIDKEKLFKDPNRRKIL